jgi:signal transduction histidine kinase
MVAFGQALVDAAQPPELAFWSSVYALAAIGIVLTQALLIAGLLLQRKRRQRAERALRRGQSDLQASYARIRDLGGRLLNAQEAERARIARELHDDIGQQLCLLALDLASLRHSAGAPAKALLDETAFRADRIAVSVHDLSRRLHPYKLHLIGLVGALQELQHTMSQAGIPITFTHGVVPARLPDDLTLCLFRVVQEALQNALKHSSARTISVQLDVGPSELSLSVVDDGVGFDVDSAWGHGLGLVSIRERLDAIGGSLEIHARPGVGTRLDIRAALADLDARPWLPLEFVEEIKSPARIHL